MDKKTLYLTSLLAGGLGILGVIFLIRGILPNSTPSNSPQVQGVSEVSEKSYNNPLQIQRQNQTDTTSKSDSDLWAEGVFDKFLPTIQESKGILLVTSGISANKIIRFNENGGLATEYNDIPKSANELKLYSNNFISYIDQDSKFGEDKLILRGSFYLRELELDSASDKSIVSHFYNPEEQTFYIFSINKEGYSEIFLVNLDNKVESIYEGLELDDSYFITNVTDSEVKLTNNKKCYSLSLLSLKLKSEECNITFTHPGGPIISETDNAYKIVSPENSSEWILLNKENGVFVKAIYLDSENNLFYIKNTFGQDDTLYVKPTGVNTSEIKLSKIPNINYNYQVISYGNYAYLININSIPMTIQKLNYREIVDNQNLESQLLDGYRTWEDVGTENFYEIGILNTIISLN